MEKEDILYASFCITEKGYKYINMDALKKYSYAVLNKQEIMKTAQIILSHLI